jgi:hypothetical protein
LVQGYQPDGFIGNDEITVRRGLANGDVSASSTRSPTLLDTGVAAVRVSNLPHAATRKRSTRVYDDAQRANAVKQNARRSAILKAKTAAKRNARSTEAGVQGTRAGTGTMVDAAATKDSRIVGAVADWWERKRSAPPESTGIGVKRFRLNCKTPG